jgi:ppGpp synthetase/RelA/SpoT-type nucleotidyltranferase
MRSVGILKMADKDDGKSPEDLRADADKATSDGEAAAERLNEAADDLEEAQNEAEAAEEATPNTNSEEDE